MAARLLGISCAIYLVGIASLFFLDLIIASYEQADAIADWAHFRSLLPFVPPLLLLGMNMAVLRHVELVDIALQVCAILSLLAVVTLALALPIGGALFTISALLAVSSTILLASVLRTKHMMVSAQLNLNAWKVICLALAALSLRSYGVLAAAITVSAALLFSMMAILIPDFRPRMTRRWRSDVLAAKEKLLDSVMLALSSVTTGFSVSFFLFFSTLFFSSRDIADIFKLIVLIQSPAVIAAGFAGFALTPIIRVNLRVRALYLKYRYAIYVLVALIQTAAMPVILSIGEYAFPDTIGHERAWIISFLAIESVARVCYTIDTSYFGAVFKTDELKTFIVITGLLLLIATALAMFGHLLGLITPEVLVGLSMIHWISRCLGAGRLISKGSGAL